METCNKLTKSLASLLFVLTFFISLSATAMPIGRISYEDRGLSDLVEDGDFGQLIELLTLRKECREQSSYEECGIDPYEIIMHTNDYDMNLLYQVVTHDFDSDYFPVTSEQKLTVVSLLLGEGLDYLSPLRADGDSALTLAIKYKNVDIFLSILDGATVDEKSSILRNFYLYGNSLSHIAAKYMPEDERLHEELKKYGFNYNEKNRNGWTAKKLKEVYLREKLREL